MPILDRPATIVAAVAYLAVVVAIGVWAARRTRSAKDFFIAGQGVGLVVTGLATTTAAFSGFVFLGGPGLTYRMGAASFWICVSTSFTAAMLVWVVGKRLRLMAAVEEIYTVPDAVFARYGSRRASGLAAVAVVVGTVGYLGAQLLALGILVESIFGLRALLGDAALPAAMAAGLLVVLFYATAGGMLAGVWTDLFQGALMMGAAVAVFAYALDAGGGIGGITRSIAASERFGPAFLDPVGTVPALTGLGLFFVFSVGTLGQPHMLHKFYMLDDPRKLRWLPLVIAVSQSVCLLIWIGVGLAVPALVARGALPPLANPDEAAPAFLLAHVPDALAGLVFAGVLAAIMSTADSFLNVGAAALVRDLPRAAGRPLADELRWGRLATVGLGVAAAAFAWAYGDLIALLGTFAFGTFGAALAPALAVGLNWRRVPAAAASASIATGLVLNLVLEFLDRQTFFPALPKPPLAEGALPTAVSLAASFAVLLLVTWIAPRRRAARAGTAASAGSAASPAAGP
ncbi:MAG TPA: sodium/proline symporter [Thermoanaerobaculia bacterium]|nr:sodium/proline symporter [Thermoanaerobaculia bacterium]